MLRPSYATTEWILTESKSLYKLIRRISSVSIFSWQMAFLSNFQDAHLPVYTLLFALI